MNYRAEEKFVKAERGKFIFSILGREEKKVRKRKIETTRRRVIVLLFDVISIAIE